MAREFEIIGAGAIGALLHGKPHHAPEPGTLCSNCGAELQGYYCHVCGQSSHDTHRSIWHLMWEGIEGLTHLDGRLGQTLPALFLNPGKLARDHLEGRRQRHVPPFRLFLITLLIFMFVLESLFHGATTQQRTVVHGQTVTVVNGKRQTANVVFVSPSQVKDIVAKAQAAKADAASSAASAPGIHFDVGAPPSGKLASVKIDKTESTDVTTALGAMDDDKDVDKSSQGRWLHEHLKRAVANKEYYTMVLFTWAHRLAILLLPILAGLLALVYVRRRQFFIYDHLIVAMQFLSFEFLIFAIAWLIPDPVRGWALWIATLWTPVNLYMTLRGAYGSRAITAMIKTIFLWFSTMFLFGLLMIGLMTLALAEM
jgi:hypothetical protein